MYNFEEFIAEIKDMDWQEMIEAAELEVDRVYHLSFDSPEAAEARNQGSMKYVQQLRNFLFFLKFRRLSGEQSTLELDIYRKITEKLISKEQWLPSVFDRFS